MRLFFLSLFSSNLGSLFLNDVILFPNNMVLLFSGLNFFGVYCSSFVPFSDFLFLVTISSFTSFLLLFFGGVSLWTLFCFFAFFDLFVFFPSPTSNSPTVVCFAIFFLYHVPWGKLVGFFPGSHRIITRVEILMYSKFSMSFIIFNCEWLYI